MARPWPPEGDGLAEDREQAIAQAEEAFELLRDGMTDDCPTSRPAREMDPWSEALATAKQSEFRHD